MNCSKLTLAAIFTLMTLVGGLSTAAHSELERRHFSRRCRATAWRLALAQAFYKQAIEIEQKTLGAEIRPLQSASTTWQLPIRIRPCMRRRNSLRTGFGDT